MVYSDIDSVIKKEYGRRKGSKEDNNNDNKNNRTTTKILTHLILL